MSDPHTPMFAIHPTKQKAWRGRVASLRVQLGVANEIPPDDFSWVTSVEALLERIEALEHRLEDIEGEPM